MRTKDENKKEKIKKITLDLVAKAGIAGVKMAVIAKKADISPSTLYVYYKSKKELLISLFKEVTLKIFKDIKPSDENVPYKLYIKNYYANVLRFKTKNYNIYNYMRMFMISPYLTEELHNLLDERAESLIQKIEEGRKKLVLKDNINIDILLCVLDGTTDKLVEYQFKGRLKINDELIEDSFNVVWDAIKQ
jgi:AcrR family transcriptional regulator